MAAAAPPHVHIGGPGLQPAIVSAVPRPKTKGRLLRHLLRERPGLLKRLLRRKRLRKAQRVVPVLPTVPGKPLRNEFRRGGDCIQNLRYTFFCQITMFIKVRVLLVFGLLKSIN